MQSWEHTISRLLSAVGLNSIKAKILAFGVLATLLPSLTLARLSYVHNKQALTEKTNAELRNVSSHTARETDLWLKERFYDVRVFSNSYEVSENLDRILRGQIASSQDLAARGRLGEYLRSVRERFNDYDDLMVIDPQMRVVATSTGQLDTLHLPPEWLDQVVNDEQVIGSIYWDDALQRPIITLAVPIVSTTGRFLGVMAGKVNFLTIDRLIRSLSLGETGHVYLVADGRTIFASSVLPTLVETRLPATTVPGILAGSAEYPDYSGNRVVGTGELVPLVEWAVVAEVGTEEAYAPIARMRNQALLMVSALMLGIGLTAYLLGLTIVRPLDRLTNGAGNVAAGDLGVDLPVVSGGEVGYLTRVFNEMVARLRHGREELERLAVTDDLTGLQNSPDKCKQNKNNNQQ